LAVYDGLYQSGGCVHWSVNARSGRAKVNDAGALLVNN